MELRPFINLYNTGTELFPMLFIKHELGDGLADIQMADYHEPVDGSIFTIGNRRYELLNIKESRPSKGDWGLLDTPTWFNMLCRNVTDCHIRWAGENNDDKILIDLSALNKQAA